MSFSDRLITLRKEKGWSQEEFGDKLNVTRQTVSKWELGQTTPEMNKLIEISRLFDTSIDLLVENEPRQQTYQPNNEDIIIHASGYTYTSKRKIGNIPLVHVNFGIGAKNAKGIIAIGNTAIGVVSIGLCSVGVISLGLLSLGLLSFGMICIGAACFGGVSIGLVSLGGVAVGLLSLGGVAVGGYSFGGTAIASNLAVGGYAEGHIALGDVAKGDYAYSDYDNLSKAELEKVRAKIAEEYPDFPESVLALLTTENNKK